MTQLKLYFLGSPRMERNGRIVTADTRKATALLAYLTLSGERLTRDTLAALLWPDLNEKRAKAALRRTLSSLKAAIGGTPLYATREQIGIEASHVWCDVIVFEEAVAAAEMETAVDLYRDDFLSGFSLRDALPFDDWQLHQTEYLRRQLDIALSQVIQQAINRRDFEEGITLAHRWLQLDSLREEAHCQLMRLYAWHGQRAAAMQQYRDCVRILDEELGVPPLPETTALYQDIQADNLTRWQDDAVPENASALPAPTPAQSFIGREAELMQMQALYQQVGPDGRFLIIEGEPGIGKTWLAEQLLRNTAAAGAITLAARCYEGETTLAYAPIVQLLQEGLAGPNAASLDTLPAHHIAEAARLLPELAIGRTLPPLPDLNTPGAQVRFYEGIAHLLTTLLTGPIPGILWLDDAHWLDAASQELLLYLLHRAQKRPFLFLLCWRTADLAADNPLPTLRRTDISATIRPQRFTPDEVQTLLDKSGLTFAPDLPDRLYQETEGLPFFVVAYLQSLQTHDGAAGDEPLPTPASVRDLLHQRLHQIGETERQIVQTAAAIGHSFDLNLVQAASGRTAEETVSALERLTARGLLQEQASREDAAYDFSHDKLRALVYEEMGLARRRLLHRRLAETLAQRRTMPTTAVSAQIATHYQQAGLDADAADYFVQAGDQARTLYAHRDAIHYYQAALALGAPDAWRLHMACGALYLRLGVYPQALASFEKAAASAPLAELGTLEHKLAQVYQRQGEWALAATTLSRAQQRLENTAAPGTLAQVLLDRSLVAQRQQQPDAALALAQQARELAEATSDAPALAQAFNMLGLLARNRGELETAVSLLQQSQQLAHENGRLDIQIAAHNNLALTLDAAGQLDAACATLEQALTIVQRLGDRHYEAALRSNLADVLHQLGEKSAAQAQIKQSVTLYAEIGRSEKTWRAEIWQLTAW